MAVIRDGDAAPLVARASEEVPPKQLIFGDEVGLEIDELERRGIIGRGEPGGSYKRTGATFVDASSVSITSLVLTGHGGRLYELMGLTGISEESRQELLANLWQVGPTEQTGV